MLLRHIVLLSLVTPIFSVSFADEQTDKAAELTRLRQRIEALQQNLQQNRSQYSHETREQRRTEKEIGNIRRQIRLTDQSLQKTRKKIVDLQHEQKQLDGQLQQHKDRLAQQIRSAYLSGRQPTIKLLLNQSRPETLTRVMTYNRYFSESRQQQIGAVNVQLTRLDRTTSAIQDKQIQLNTLKNRQMEQNTALSGAREQRNIVLASLKRDISGQEQTLQRLRRNEQELESLLQQLQGILSDIPASLGDSARFASARQKMRLPLKGRPDSRFGESKGAGDLRWKGVFIQARTGTPVQAPFRGRVAYADWLRGFGLLLILEHGDGYMTLYGHNESLFKGVGDWVEANETIAVSGNTGNPPRPGLYFEIRYNGKPQDPMRWCKLH